MAGRLAGKVAIVSGGARGLGGAQCARFVEEGARVLVADLDLETAKAHARILSPDGSRAQACRLDVAQEADWREAFALATAAWGGVDILVNNAGIIILGDVEVLSLADWRQTQAVNLDGVFLGAREAVRAMRERGGSIVNIGSVMAIAGDHNLAAYNAAKGGVRTFTKSAALHCAKQGYAIRVNAVHPGYVMTENVRRAAGKFGEPETVMAGVAQRHPVGRLGRPEEIANAVLFLASDEASFITGVDLPVDGGFLAQ